MQKMNIFVIILAVHNLIYKKLATLVEGDLKAPFSIATTPRYKEGQYSIPWYLIYKQVVIHTLYLL